MSHHQIDEAEMFAEDILIFVMNESSFLKSSSRNLRPCRSSSPVTSSIRLAVRRCLERNDETVRNIFNALLDARDLDAYFKLYAHAMSLLVSARPYRAGEFVQFCGILCRLAVLCYARSAKGCLTHALTAIAEALNFHRESGAFLGWDHMSRAVLFQ